MKTANNSPFFSSVLWNMQHVYIKIYQLTQLHIIEAMH